jgi:ligand-binding SRPBCC domain-containing protein
METIRLATWIDAPVERCFLLSLNIDLHLASTRSTRERVIDGVMSGQIAEGQTVTFQARHFGLRLKHTSRIETLRPYSYFRDVMVAGIFKHFEHDHHFAAMDDGTRMRDEIHFSTRLGPLAKLFARKRLIALLIERNSVIKGVAESEEWRKYLDSETAGSTTVPIVGETAGRRDRNVLRVPRQIVVPRPPNG